MYTAKHQKSAYYLILVGLSDDDERLFGGDDLNDISTRAEPTKQAKARLRAARSADHSSKDGGTKKAQTDSRNSP